ncbi:MAG: cadherin-like domain-containing protein [Verrucomicrobiales bacterium]|nr:cadherin-like domain-containing protein [Verrucomicrobiales bacterium]
MRISPVLLSLVFSSSLAIAAPPVAVEDAYSLSEDAPLTKSGTDGMRSNDNAGAAADPVVGLVTSPLHGVLTLSPDGGFTYVPTTNFNGSDSFLYKVFGDRAASAFTIDENASSLKIGATLRITF